MSEHMKGRGVTLFCWPSTSRQNYCFWCYWNWMKIIEYNHFSAKFFCFNDDTFKWNQKLNRASWKNGHQKHVNHFFLLLLFVKHFLSNTRRVKPHSLDRIEIFKFVNSDLRNGWKDQILDFKNIKIYFV